MDYIDLQGKKVSNITNQDKLLSFLYTNIFGRMLLKPLIQPQYSPMPVGFQTCRTLSFICSLKMADF